MIIVIFSAILTKEGVVAVTKKHILLILSLFLILLSGSQPAPGPRPRYVVAAQVQFTQPGQERTLYYHQQEKLTSLLTCLRLAAPKGLTHLPPQDETAHRYRITLFYSNGTQNVFLLENYRYLSSDGKTWQKIPDKKAHLLYLLVHLLPEDPGK